MSVSIAAMAATWRNVKLPDLQAELDEKATDLAAKSSESEVSRKKLIGASKAFKKESPEEARKSAAPLLKLFQGEVDALSKRSKAAETAFLNTYKRIIELADPLPALEAAELNLKKLQKAKDIEVENQKLKDTINGYKKDFAEMKGHEITIQKLNQKIKELESENDNNVSQCIDEKERELQSMFSEKERELLETQQMVAGKLGQTEQRAALTQQKLESLQNELLEIRAKYEEERQAKTEELDMLESDLERATHRAETAEKEADQLREKLSSSVSAVEHSSDNSDLSANLAGLEAELSRKEREINHLSTEFSAASEKSQVIVAQLNRQLDALTEKNEKLISEKTELESALVDQKDFCALKKELDILKSTQFAGEDEQKIESQSLETLLLSQNRGLQTENSQLRKQNISITNDLKQSGTNVQALQSQVQNQEALIEKLEKDLLMVNALPSAYRTTGDGQSSPPNAQADFLADAVKEVAQKSTALLSDQMLPNAASQHSDSSLLTIVQSQRERFRLRVQDLEHENMMQTQSIQSLTQEIEQMRLDNIKLYEKIKFLQNYRPNSSNYSNTINDDEAGRKYAGQYENQLDPFAKFSKSEKQRKYASLSPIDKFSLNMGQFILGNKMARTFVFIYTIVIHCLLYLILYKFGNTTDCKHHLAELCYEQFGDSRSPN